MLGLISVDQALEIVLQSPCRLPPEEVDFEHAVGRVLAEDVRSDLDLPPFSRSAVDGFALRAQDLRPVPRRLKVVGMVRAGSFPSFKIEPGQAAQIMTGAPVPDGADAVQMVEHTQRAGEEVEIRQGLSAGQNVAPRASEVKAGELVLRGGTRIDPAAVAVAATVGSTRLRVGRRPRVAVIATGDELVHPSRKPGPGRIRNSNGFALVAQARAAGAQVSYLGVAGDNEESLVGLIGHGLQHRDVLLLSGGVSMGRFDLVESVLEGFEVKLLINAVALKPGKPLVFGLAPKGNLVFGLPGNPVSTMVTFELFVRPALARLEGCQQPARSTMEARLKAPLTSRGPRRAYLPGWLQPEEPGGPLVARPIPTRGSGDIVAFSKANSLLIVPEDRERLEAGDAVQVYPLDSFLSKEDRWGGAASGGENGSAPGVRAVARRTLHGQR